MSGDERECKKLKTERLIECIICNNNSNEASPVLSPRDFQSWLVLYDAALKRQFSPIVNLSISSDSDLLKVKYHRQCRANFTHPKSLKALITPGELDLSSSSQSEDASTSTVSRDRIPRDILRSGSVVYKKICIFCEKESKYVKGSNTRESLTQAVSLQSDETLRKLAVERCDTKILAVTSRDIVAAEANYHKTCYIKYTRKRTLPKPKSVDPYLEVEKFAYQKLFDYIRTDMFVNKMVYKRNDLILKLISYFPPERKEEIRESTKTNFRYNLLKEFGNSLRFISVDRASYIIPDNLSFDELFEKYIETKNELEKTISGVENAEIFRVAEKIRTDVKKIDRNQVVWPPSPSELHSESVSVPSSLNNFIACLLKSSSPSGLRLSWSFSQDIIYAILRGKISTPKHILLAMTVKSLTGNVELISILNRLGHCCSYTKLLEIDTALCLQKITSIKDGQIPLPNSIHSGVPTIVAFDNIDRNEETLSGAGTSHRVNGIIIQATSDSCLPPRLIIQDENKKKRNVNVLSSAVLDYIVGRRYNPSKIVTMKLPAEHVNSFFESNRKNLIWILSRLHNSSNQTVASWTGFNILTRDNVEIGSNTIAYLPSINNPATDMSTVYEILRESEEIRRSLGLGKIVVVLDQAIFSKAMEVKWARQREFENVFMMMGNFHAICILISIIGKLFGNAGLRDLAVESGTISEGSISKVLEGKQYNRGVRLHKCVYESMMRIIWTNFLEEACANDIQLPLTPEEMSDIFSSFSQNICQNRFESILGKKEIAIVMDLFADYLNKLRYKSGPLSSFWMSYIDLVELLLGLIRANREGNWLLYLTCLEEMVPWCFSLDKINYARYLSIHFAELSRLNDTDPALFKFFESGQFSVQLRSKNPFAKIPVDQALEETVNKDTQTAGGTKGFSLKPNAVSRYYLTAEFRASALGKIREIVEFAQNKNADHPDLHKTRICKDEQNVCALSELLENEWTNPFDKNPSNIVHLSTGVEVSVEVQNDLLSAKEKGKKAYDNFKQDRLETNEGFYDPIKKIQLKMFKSSGEMKRKIKNKEVILKTDRNLFGNIILIAENRNLDMQEVFSHPLGPLPWSLANPDGSLKKTNKSTLANFLESKIGPSDGISGDSALVIDAMALVHKLQAENHTFDEISDLLLFAVLKVGNFSKRIDVVFDIYKEKSIKCTERVHRGSDEGISFRSLKSGHKIQNWKRILRSSKSKNKVTKFLAESWKDDRKRQYLQEKTLFVTCEEKCFRINSEIVEEVPELTSSHEEADTRMMLHIQHASKHFQNIVCNADDTDVLILCAYASMYIENGSTVYVKRGKKNRIRLINVNKLVSALGSEFVTALLSIHAFTGCDSVSSLAGQGKLKAIKLLLKEKKFIALFSKIGQEWTVQVDIFEQIQVFVSQLYLNRTKIKKVNDARYQLFRSKQGAVTSVQLPPCKDCLYQHVLRANYQSAIWKRCLENSPIIPDPENYGWTTDELGNLSIKWMTGLPAPEVVLDLLSCSCSRSCILPNCSCLLNNLKCTPACKLDKCENMRREIEEDEICMIEDDIDEFLDSDDED